MNETPPDDLLREAAELLNEVHTGEDFEVKCWSHAERIEAYLKEKKKLEKKPI